ncbi:MAG: tetratricopeptide repeat protein [bacterium]
MKKTIYFLVVYFSFVLSAFAQGGHKQVAEGNKLYAEEKYDEANNKYRDALIENPESPVVHFNIGDALFKKRNYDEAIKSYEKATFADDIRLQAQSYYNLGNSLYKMGKLPESIMMYKKALELNPNDEDAKYNLEYVRAKLKDNAQKQPQQNQDQQQQDQQQQENQQQNQDQQQSQQEQQEQQQEQPAQSEENQEQQQQEEQQQQAAQQQEISKEDAERILEALQNEEQDLLKKQRAKKPRRAFRGKDW